MGKGREGREGGEEKGGGMRGLERRSLRAGL